MSRRVRDARRELGLEHGSRLVAGEVVDEDAHDKPVREAEEDPRVAPGVAGMRFPRVDLREQARALVLGTALRLGEEPRDLGIVGGFREEGVQTLAPMRPSGASGTAWTRMCRSRSSGSSGSSWYCACAMSIIASHAARTSTSRVAKWCCTRPTDTSARSATRRKVTASMPPWAMSPQTAKMIDSRLSCESAGTTAAA